MKLPAIIQPGAVSRIKKRLPQLSNPFVMVWYALQKGDARTAEIISFPKRDYSFKDISFTFAMIGLSARIATSSGNVNKEQYIAFREAFPFEGDLCDKLRLLFSMACADQTPFTQYVRHMTLAYPRRMSLYIGVVERLFVIAAARGTPNKETEQTISKIARMFQISPIEYGTIRSKHLGKKKAHNVMGMSKKYDAKSLRKRYYQLMQQYHPDHMAHKNLTPELELMCQLKVSEINSAYSQLKKKAA